MTVRLEQHDGWAAVILDRAARRNAITGPLGEALADCLETAAADPTNQAVLLHGAGGAFCSGLDLGDFNADPPPAWLPGFQQTWRRAHSALFNCPVPVVCAMQKYAINGGAALALAADLLVVGEQAFLQVGEITLGMAAPYNMAWLALRHSEAVAAQLVYSGERVPGQRLQALGLAQHCVADAQVLDRAIAICTALAANPPGAAARIKAGVRARRPGDADAWFDRFTAA